MANEVTVKKNGVLSLIQQSVKELGKALPSHMNPERLVRIASTTMRLNPKLFDCTPQSFIGALFQCAQLGLEPNVEGQAYIIPYKSGHTVSAQFQIGYKGYVELFYRHESAISLHMDKVCLNDTFDYQYGTDPHITHIPSLEERGKVIAYYAVATMKGGSSAFKVMSQKDCLDHGKKFSKCYSARDKKFFSGTPWASNPDAMCMKTVLIQLMKLLPKSIEIQRALAMDETVKTKVSADMLGVPDETDWNEGKQAGKPDVAMPEAKNDEGEQPKGDATLFDEQKGKK